MNNLTYKELLDHLLKMNDETLQSNVSIVLLETSEVLPVKSFVGHWGWLTNGEFKAVDGVLDDGHPFLTIDF